MDIAPKCKIMLNLLSHIPWKSKKNLIHILPVLLFPSQPGGAQSEADRDSCPCCSWSYSKTLLRPWAQAPQCSLCFPVLESQPGSWKCCLVYKVTDGSRLLDVSDGEAAVDVSWQGRGREPRLRLPDRFMRKKRQPGAMTRTEVWKWCFSCDSSVWGRLADAWGKNFIFGIIIPLYIDFFFSFFKSLIADFSY